MDNVLVETLFEVLGNAGLMGITDLEEEIKNHMKLVQGSSYKDAVLVFKAIQLLERERDVRRCRFTLAPNSALEHFSICPGRGSTIFSRGGTGQSR